MGDRYVLGFMPAPRVYKSPSDEAINRVYTHAKKTTFARLRFCRPCHSSTDYGNTIVSDTTHIKKEGSKKKKREVQCAYSKTEL